MKRVITAIFIVLSITGCSVINQTSTYELSSAKGQSKAYAFYKGKLDTPRYMYAWSATKNIIENINDLKTNGNFVYGTPSITKNPNLETEFVVQSQIDMATYANVQLASGGVVWYGSTLLFSNILNSPANGLALVIKENTGNVSYMLAANTEIRKIDNKPIFPTKYTFSDDVAMFDDYSELTSVVSSILTNAKAYVTTNNNVGKKETYMVSRESIPLSGTVTGDAKMYYQKYKLANTDAYKALQVQMDSANLGYGGKELEIAFTYRTYEYTGTETSDNVACLEGAIYDGTRYWLFSQNTGFIDLDIWK